MERFEVEHAVCTLEKEVAVMDYDKVVLVPGMSNSIKRFKEEQTMESRPEWHS